MNARVVLTINLIAVALILVLLPNRNHKKGQPKPSEQVTTLFQDVSRISVDQAARYLNNSDSTVQFIDVRTPEAFQNCNIPGSINIPYNQLFDKNVQGYLNQNAKLNILYSNGDVVSNIALTLLDGLGYTNNTVLKGGLNEWFKTVMQVEYKGGRLTARENSIYENRFKARDLFTEINSLPDSLKNTALEAKVLEEIQLDGGCE